VHIEVATPTNRVTPKEERTAVELRARQPKERMVVIVESAIASIVGP
jgi:hypothetical protein